MELSWYWFLLHAYGILTVTLGEYACDGTPCPQETPYCTTVGCVSKCPENSFENGTRCVVSCGDGVVAGNKCRDACPANKTVTVDKVQVLGTAFKKVRFCFHDCKSFDIHSFAYGNTCVRKCPDEFKFVVNNTCVPMCPGDQSLRIEKKPNKNQSYVECTNRCPLQKPFVKNQTCVSHCNDGEVIFGETCVTRCPNNSYVVYNNECVTDCPDLTFRTNTSCSICPLSDPVRPKYIYNGACVDGCPDDFRYLRMTTIQADNEIEKGKYCVKDCREDYYLGRDCVQQCPADTVVANKSCVHSCPTATPFLLSEQKRGWYTQEVTEPRCVAECPGHMLISNNSCTEHCPSLIFNRTCVQNCPADFPFSATSRCLTRCPEFTFIQNFTCVSSCPHVSYNNACVVSCPNATFSENKKCVTECQQNTFYNDNKCVSTCSKGNFVYNQTCIETCPSEAPFMYDKCKIQTCFTFGYHPIVCVEKCSNSFVLNLTCVKQCPNKVYNDQCVIECPKDSPFVEENLYPSYEICVEKCGDRKVANGSTCIDQYECELSIYDGKCLDTCPDGMYWVGLDKRQGGCQSPWFFYGSIIVSLVLMIVLFVACTKFFRMQPWSCAMVYARYVIKISKRKTNAGYEHVIDDAITNGSDGNNLVV